MSIVTNGVLMVSAACLTLGIIQIRFWLTERARRDNLAFAVICFSAAVFCLLERLMMLSATPAESLFYVRWSQLPAAIALISIAWFAYLKLHGRRWLFLTYCASRVLVCSINFIIPNGINYREITAIEKVSILGETISSPVVVPNPLMFLVQLSHVLLIIFCLDASLLAWRRGNQANASVLGTTFLVFGVIILIFSVGVLWGFLPVPLLISFSVLFIVGAIVEKLYISQLRSTVLSEKLIGLIRNLMHTHDKEHARIAYKLQEELTQNLALFSFHLDELRRKPAKPEHIENQINHLASEIRNLSLDLDRMSNELHPARLRLLGLEQTLHGLCREFGTAYQVEIEFVAKDLTCKLPDDVSLSLYHVAREALQNVAEHSGASKVKVYLKLEINKIRLTISDNGKGFDLKAARAADSFGLIRISERIRAINGMVKVESKPGNGTKIEAIVPVGVE